MCQTGGEVSAEGNSNANANANTNASENKKFSELNKSIQNSGEKNSDDKVLDAAVLCRKSMLYYLEAD